MIITRTPLRITLGGGGTDLPSYYEMYGGFVISASINQYIYIALNNTFSDGYHLKYSELEQVLSIDEIKHPIVREVFSQHCVPPAIEMVSLADIPAGTGLGSSGSFTVGLLRSVYALKREYTTDERLASEACDIEIGKLGRSVGKQDQYIAAFGGIMCFNFKENGQVVAEPLSISTGTYHELERGLLMFFTGYSRNANLVLDEQRRASEAGDNEMVQNLHFVKELGLKSKYALEQGDIATFGELMNTHWEHKKNRSQVMSNSRIDHLYNVAMENGAVGGKLIGAGAGGFLLFYAPDPRRLRAALAAEGAPEVRFSFDQDGSTVAVRD